MKPLVKLVGVVLFVGMSIAQATTIHMIGDSTMANKRNPETNPYTGDRANLVKYVKESRSRGAI